MAIKIMLNEGAVVPISGRICDSCKESYDLVRQTFMHMHWTHQHQEVILFLEIFKCLWTWSRAFHVNKRERNVHPPCCYCYPNPELCHFSGFENPIDISGVRPDYSCVEWSRISSSKSRPGSQCNHNTNFIWNIISTSDRCEFSYIDQPIWSQRADQLFNEWSVKRSSNAVSWEVKKGVLDPYEMSLVDIFIDHVKLQV